MKFNLIKVAFASIILAACSPNLLEDEQAGVIITDNTTGSISGVVSQSESNQEVLDAPTVTLYKSGNRDSTISSVKADNKGAFKFSKLNLDTFDIVVDYEKDGKRTGGTKRSIILTPEDTLLVNINITINIFVTQIFNIQLSESKTFEKITAQNDYVETKIEENQISLTSSLADTTFFELEYIEDDETKSSQVIIFHNGTTWVIEEIGTDNSDVDLTIKADSADNIDLTNAVVYWDFQNTQDAIVSDLTKNQIHGSLNEYTTDAEGTLFSGEATSFASFPSIDHLISDNNFYIQTELKLESYSTYKEGIIAGYSKWDNGSTQGWEFRISQTGYPEFIIGEKGTSDWTSTMSSQKLELNKWYTLSAQFDGAHLSISIDGVEVAKLAHTSPLNLTNQKINVAKRSVGTPANTLNTKIKYIKISSIPKEDNIENNESKTLRITLDDNNSYDTYVDFGPGKRTKNFGQNTITAIGSYDNSSRQRELLKIDFNDSLKGKVIESVTLTLKVESWITKHSDAPLPIDIHKMLVNWEEGNGYSTGYEGVTNSEEVNGATYSERSFGVAWNQDYIGLDDTDASSKVYSSSQITKGTDTSITFDITELAKDWISNPDSNNGLLMRLPIEFETGSKLSYPIFHSSEALGDDNKPEVNITFID